MINVLYSSASGSELEYKDKKYRQKYKYVFFFNGLQLTALTRSSLDDRHSKGIGNVKNGPV